MFCWETLGPDTHHPPNSAADQVHHLMATALLDDNVSWHTTKTVCVWQELKISSTDVSLIHIHGKGRSQVRSMEAQPSFQTKAVQSQVQGKANRTLLSWDDHCYSPHLSVLLLLQLTNICAWWCLSFVIYSNIPERDWGKNLNPELKS